MGASNATQMGIGATLLGVPVYGTAPLTVDFYVGLANPAGSLAYKWNFSDGAVSLLSAGSTCSTFTGIPELTRARSI
jgi:hypothetical protein